MLTFLCPNVKIFGEKNKVLDPLFLKKKKKKKKSTVKSFFLQFRGSTGPFFLSKKSWF